MSPEPGERKDGITHDIVRFLAWLKKLRCTAAADLLQEKMGRERDRYQGDLQGSCSGDDACAARSFHRGEMGCAKMIWSVPITS